MPIGKQYLSLCNLSPNLVAYYHEVACYHLTRLVRKFIRLRIEGPLMSYPPLPKAAKPVVVLANELVVLITDIRQIFNVYASFKSFI